MAQSAVVDPLFLSFQLALAGRYSIDRELGRGGMGIVYLAREVHLDRMVAIKLLPPERAKDSTLRERFLREARLAAKLSHPNIIPIHSVEDTNGFVFYVMAFVDGETLAQRVRTRGPLPGSEGARVLREVAWALASAHGQGLVHRDVKPDNILLESASSRVMVADFGIAAAMGDATDGVSGTPEFMSPEQALGKSLDARSDLYSLGATAFYAFSGRFPFEGATATEILAKQVTEAPRALASLGLPLPKKITSLVDRCLAKDPALRPESAQALAEQLGVALEQRRELPVALRAFVKRSARLDGGGTLVSIFGLGMASVVVSSIYGGAAGFATLLAGATVGPFVYFTNAARRLMLLGYAHDDLGPAFRSELEQAREELAVVQRASPSLLERTLPFVAKATGAVFGSSLLALALAAAADMGRYWPGWEPLAMISVFSFSGMTMSTLAHLSMSQNRRDVDTGFWSGIWMSRIGKGAFGLAKKLLGNRARASAMTHRATELSLGMAAEQLYESLPKATQKDLGDLPALLQRLQDDAQLLRKRYNDLQEVLGDASDASSASYADVRAARDAVHAKLGEAVGALETIRLNLLRLHAGSESVQGLTTHLGLAAELSDEVQRLIAAQQEAESAMRFPRLSSATPA